MAKAFKCDKCGEFEEGSVPNSLTLNGTDLYVRGQYTQRIELCDSCAKSCAAALNRALSEIDDLAEAESHPPRTLVETLRDAANEVEGKEGVSANYTIEHEQIELMVGGDSIPKHRPGPRRRYFFEITDPEIKSVGWGESSNWEE